MYLSPSTGYVWFSYSTSASTRIMLRYFRKTKSRKATIIQKNSSPFPSLHKYSVLSSTFLLPSYAAHSITTVQRSTSHAPSNVPTSPPYYHISHLPCHPPPTPHVALHWSYHTEPVCMPSFSLQTRCSEATLWVPESVKQRNDIQHTPLSILTYPHKTSVRRTQPSSR